jgi:hypothetical protein
VTTTKAGITAVNTQATASAVSLLGTLATELMEDGSIVVMGATRLPPQALAQTLRSIGADIVALANAIEVLDRRMET